MQVSGSLVARVMSGGAWVAGRVIHVILLAIYRREPKALAKIAVTLALIVVLVKLILVMRHQPDMLVSMLLSFAMLAIGALLLGGWWMIFRRGQRTKGVLMIVCAAVVLGNVMIATL